MKETRLACDRCGKSGEYVERPKDWAELETSASFVLLEIVDERLDLCPSCKLDLEEWILDERRDLSDADQMALKGMRDIY